MSDTDPIPAVGARLRIGAVPLSVGPDLRAQVLEALRGTLARASAPILVTFCNPGSHMAARRDSRFADDLQRFDAVLPDGIGMVVAARSLGAVSERLSFDSTSLALPVLRIAVECGARVGLVGGQPGVAASAARHLAAELEADPFEFVQEGYATIEELTARILERAPDLLICGMGTGRQERLLLALRDAGWRGSGFTCGGYFDQLSNGLGYYPEIANRLHLRAAYRLAREPGRLGPRYLIDYPRFGLAVAAELARRAR